PYVENAIWLGLLHKSGDRNLVISVRKKNSKIIIEIRDNGIGRKAAMEIKSKNAVRKKSFGMKISADRLKVMKEIYQTEIQLEITDLYDEENRPAGTAVYITIPIYE
ncbi:MAG: histidine kinase, partial [Bacteroidota bacterium]